MKKGKLIKKLDVLPQAWKVSLEIKPLKILRRHSNILRGTIGGNHREKYGERIPAIFFKGRSTKLIICSSINDNANYLITLSPALPLNKWTKIIVQQIQKDDFKYHYEIFIDGKQKLSIVNKKPKIFKNVKYYTSDPFYPAANAMIRNVVIETYQPKGNAMN